MVIIILKRLGDSVERRVISLTHTFYTFDQKSASLHILIPIVYVGVVASVIVPKSSFEAIYKVKTTYLLGC